MGHLGNEDSDSNVVALGWSLRLCVSNRLLAFSHLRTILWVTRSKRTPRILCAQCFLFKICCCYMPSYIYSTGKLNETLTLQNIRHQGLNCIPLLLLFDSLLSALPDEWLLTHHSWCVLFSPLRILELKGTLEVISLPLGKRTFCHSSN